jgi:hypothetical protein
MTMISHLPYNTEACWETLQRERESIVPADESGTGRNNTERFKERFKRELEEEKVHVTKRFQEKNLKRRINRVAEEEQLWL